MREIITQYDEILVEDLEKAIKLIKRQTFKKYNTHIEVFDNFAFIKLFAPAETLEKIKEKVLNGNIKVYINKYKNNSNFAKGKEEFYNAKQITVTIEMPDILASLVTHNTNFNGISGYYNKIKNGVYQYKVLNYPFIIRETGIKDIIVSEIQQAILLYKIEKDNAFFQVYKEWLYNFLTADMQNINIKNITSETDMPPKMIQFFRKNIPITIKDKQNGISVQKNISVHNIDQKFPINYSMKLVYSFDLTNILNIILTLQKNHKDDNKKNLILKTLAAALERKYTDKNILPGGKSKYYSRIDYSINNIKDKFGNTRKEYTINIVLSHNASKIAIDNNGKLIIRGNDYERIIKYYEKVYKKSIIELYKTTAEVLKNVYNISLQEALSFR